MTIFDTAQADMDPSGFLTRLRKDKRGNTIAMMAMGLIMLAGMAGSAVDVGRTYLVKTRLQQACDAGVLAGRRAMTTAAVDGPVITQATNFFNQNFANGNASATNVVFTPAAAVGANAGQITASATARVPMSIMQLFGKTSIDLTVDCDARLEVSNTDVLMVLDVTGSMADCPDGNNSCAGGAGSKIEGLRAAVVDFHTTVSNATGPNARFRLGFAPYSSASNMGTDPFNNTALLNAGWIVDSWTYQSRVANMTTGVIATWTSRTSATNTPETFGSSISQDACRIYGRNGALPQIVSGAAPTIVGRTYRNDSDEGVDWGWSGAPDTTGNNRSCRRESRIRTYSGATTAFGFTDFSYRPVAYNTSVFKTGATVNVYTAPEGPYAYKVTNSGSYNMVDLVSTVGSTVPGTATTFSGCIEERDTVAQATYASVPGGAYDLDVITTPTSDATRWRPMWTQVVYDRNGTANEDNVWTERSPTIETYCPAAASKLVTRDAAAVLSYTNSLQPTGFTFHDLGMAWGARMISPTGMWAAENTTAPNGRAISRHIIYMTDGDMVTPDYIYTPHGYEKLDRRVSGGNTPDYDELVSRHNERFQALCNAARNNNITVWTVAFGTANPPTLVSCASPGKSFVATDTATLRANFQQIASQIAELRLSQ